MSSIPPILESVAKVLIVNDSNQALILTVGEWEERPDKSFKPDLPGGLVEPSETEKDAAVREVQEETSITITSDQLELAYTATEFYETLNRSVSRFFYLCRLDTTPDVTISWEHASYGWVPVKDLLSTTELRTFYKNAVEYCSEHGLL